jgi:hypothetical protein
MMPSVPTTIVKAADSTVDKVYMFFDLKASTDFIALATGTTNLASQYMDTFTRTRSSLVSGNHRLDIVAFETLPTGLTRVNHKTFTRIQSQTGAGLGAGDVNADGVRNAKDIQAFTWILIGFNPNYGPAADMNCDGLNDENDIPLLVDQLLLQ